MSPSQEFPYQDGDVTVLGPEIFATKDGTVISWRGENYVLQQDAEAPRDLTADAVHELASSVRDLASAIRLENAEREQQRNLSLRVGPLDAGQIGTEIGNMLRKTRRQNPGAGV